jgi:hypothetical protein
MKLNKWTIALATVGVVSLASAAKAEEKAVNTVQTALAATTISGYVDTSAQWNIGSGNANLPPYKFGGPSKADGFNLDVVQVRIEKTLDEAEWAAGYRVDLWMGPDANVLGTQSILGTGASDFAIRQAYVALRTPIGNGIDWKVGVFDSIIGYESVESPNNPNYTRSYGHSIEPQTHTGVLASYRVCDFFSMSAGIADTMGPTINGRDSDPFGPKAESYKTFMGSIALTAPKSMGFLEGSTLYAGIVSGFSPRTYLVDATTTPITTAQENQTSYYVGATVATPVTGLRLGASFDLLDVQADQNSVAHGGETWSLAGYASFQATEKLSLHGRVEYLKDRGPQKFFTGTFHSDPTDATSALGVGDTAPNGVFALTGTVQYDLWKNVISRLEVRWDHATEGPEVWGGTVPGPTADLGSGPRVGGGDQKDEIVIAANLIYKF